MIPQTRGPEPVQNLNTEAERSASPQGTTDLLTQKGYTAMAKDKYDRDPTKGQTNEQIRAGNEAARKLNEQFRREFEERQAQRKGGKP